MISSVAEAWTDPRFHLLAAVLGIGVGFILLIPMFFLMNLTLDIIFAFPTILYVWTKLGSPFAANQDDALVIGFLVATWMTGVFLFYLCSTIVLWRDDRVRKALLAK